MRRLPPLNALRVFEVAARTGSYAEAGTELGLTHGAVSRQIALLEGWLGQRLFVRAGRRMVATPAARAFAAEVSLSFDRVIAAADACGRPDARRILRVSAPTTFAMRWLIPVCLASMPSRRWKSSVTTVTTVHDEFRGGSMSRSGAGWRAEGWPQHRLVPVLGRRRHLDHEPGTVRASADRQPADIAGHTLLATRNAWRRLGRLAGAGRVAAYGRPRRQIFDHFFVTRQAVMDGLGPGSDRLPVLAG